MIKVKLKEDADIVDLAEILVNLRVAMDQWRDHHGSKFRLRKEYWENRADEWLKVNLTKL